MDQCWFEMPKIRRRKLANAVWIPLRASNLIEGIGDYGHVGYKSESCDVLTLAVPVEKKQSANKLGWTDLGNIDQHSGLIEDGEYIPADICESHFHGVSGLHLVLNQYTTSAEKPEWHLHQDFFITLGLKREGDIWIRPDEGYIKVAKISQKDGAPYRLEVRASHLRDYLCARKMALYVTSYRQRVEIFENISHITWPEDSIEDISRVIDSSDHWKGRIMPIHEGGMPYGEEMAITHIERTDVDTEEDIPVLGQPADDNTISQSWTRKETGRKLYRVESELWRTEWIEPSSQSPIVRGDAINPTVFFITDAQGNQENRETLIEKGCWLWFHPEVMSVLAHRRGGSLNWHTKDTGKVGCSPGRNVHFGVNSIGLINVYAKDIARLPEWEQKIWSGYNVAPEGKVSEELLSSQVRSIPADTCAPEKFLGEGLSRLNDIAKEKIGINLIFKHEKIPDIIKRSHRFRVTSQEGLFALAKDLTQLTAESIDVSELRKVVSPPSGTHWGSLKLLEKLLATEISPELAKKMLSPLIGIYKLRQLDAHLANLKSNDVFHLVNVDPNAPYVIQGYQLLHACVVSICEICQIIENWPDDGKE